MVIRRSMVRLLSPDELRGRVASANWIFVCASNELGLSKAGYWLPGGTIPCVAVGGVITLEIVALTAGIAKQLRNLHFDIYTLEQKKYPSAAFPVLDQKNTDILQNNRLLKKY